MSSNPYLAYVESKVISASPLQLVHLAYEGAVEAICEARVHLAAKQIRERSRCITKAQLIIRELQQTLDFASGGDVARTLGPLYSYIQRCLLNGNSQQKDEPLAEAQKLLEIVAESWKKLSAAEAGIAPLFDSSTQLSSNRPVFGATPFSYSL